MSLMDALRNRRSVRKYTGAPIPDGAIDQILQAAMLAPSSRGLFPVEYIVVRDRAMLLQLSRAKTAGSGMLRGADAAIVVIGNADRSDAWVEDCSLAMIYMQLMASDLGIGNCWVQCRGRVSQQRKNEPIATTTEDIAQVKAGPLQRMESLVAATIAQDKARTDNMSTNDFLCALLGIPQGYQVEAILSLGMPDQAARPHDLPAVSAGKVHRERY